MNIESSGFPEAKTKLKRILVRGSFILAGILLGLAVLLLITGIVFEQKARSIVLSEVQSILKPGYVIDADQITLRVFKNFPDMAVEFEQVNLHIKKIPGNPVSPVIDHYNVVVASNVSTGGTGLYVTNDEGITNQELISKSRAIVYSIIF